MRKCSNNPIEHFQIGAVQGFPQSAKKGDLRGVQRPAVKMEPLRHPNTAMTTLNGFNRIGAGQHYNVPANCPGADIKLMRQIASCLMSPEPPKSSGGVPTGSYLFFKILSQKL